MDTSSYKELWGEVKKYLTLQIDYAKLTAVEKITILVSTMTFVGIFGNGFKGADQIFCVYFFLKVACVHPFDSLMDDAIAVAAINHHTGKHYTPQKQRKYRIPMRSRASADSQQDNA